MLSRSRFSWNSKISTILRNNIPRKLANANMKPISQLETGSHNNDLKNIEYYMQAHLTKKYANKENEFTTHIWSDLNKINS